jgi:predicted DNA-binding transcriptional regulator YafY
LIGNYDKYDIVSHYRLDKMTCVSILDEKAKPQKEVKDFAQGFNLPTHMAEHIYMFSGSSVPSVPVKLRTDESMMNELIDWLGKDLRIRKLDEDGTIEVALRCNEDAMFYWALQYGPYVEIVEPESLCNRLADAVKVMYHKYAIREEK